MQNTRTNSFFCCCFFLSCDSCGSGHFFNHRKKGSFSYSGSPLRVRRHYHFCEIKPQVVLTTVGKTTYAKFIPELCVGGFTYCGWNHLRVQFFSHKCLFHHLRRQFHLQQVVSPTAPLSLQHFIILGLDQCSVYTTLSFYHKVTPMSILYLGNVFM